MKHCYSIRESVDYINSTLSVYGYKRFHIPEYYKRTTYKALTRRLLLIRESIMDSRIENEIDQLIGHNNVIRKIKGLKRIIL